MGSGEVVARRAVAVMPRFVARSKMLAGLCLETTVHPLGVGEHVEADATGLTAVPRVWVAGNVADLMAPVVGAAEAGVRAGAAINADPVANDTQRAVGSHRAQRKAQAAEGR